MSCISSEGSSLPASIKNIEADQTLGGPLRIFHPMVLCGSSLDLTIRSLSPITINGLTIWSRSPIRVIHSDQNTISIAPQTNLNAGFARGWCSLPVELKECIIAYNLVSHRTLRSQRMDKCVKWENPEISSLLHHLRSTPEIAGIARPIYYKHNTFRLSPESKYVSLPMPGRYEDVFRYRSLFVSNLIRSIQLHFSLEEIDTE